MAFMQPFIERGDFYEVETDYGTFVVPADLVGSRPRKSDFALYVEGTPESFELRRNVYAAYLSAPGYMDRTDYTLFDSKQEAEDYLHDEYPEAFDEGEDEG